jgi:pimeloyl-ACP methyl ester carboxylesterase
VDREIISIAGIDLELYDSGSGDPVLFLHGGQGFAPDDPYIALLARSRRVISPSHPGFGKSELPRWLTSVDDIAHIYLELMDKTGLATVDLVGCSIGGWIAAEMATKVPERFRKIVFVAPVGVKVGAPDKLDIPDIFAMPQDRVAQLLFHSPEKAKIDLATLTDDQLAVMVRNRETLAMLSWEPWMHNPKLRHRLHRVRAPALFVRGESDGLVSPEYMTSYANLLPDARIKTLAEAGHALSREKPEALAEMTLSFLDS